MFHRHGKRKPGTSTHAVYLKYVQDLLGDSDGMLQPNIFSSLTQDLQRLRNLVVACSEPNDDKVMIVKKAEILSRVAYVLRFFWESQNV